MAGAAFGLLNLEEPPSILGSRSVEKLEQIGEGTHRAQRRKLVDISNLQGHAKQSNIQESNQQQNNIFSSQEYVEKLQKENMTLMKALAHRNKIIELSGVEFQKLRINLRNVQENNLQLAHANSQILAELNTNKDRLKLLQHELGCNNVLVKARKMQLEEQAFPHHTSKDKALENVSDGDCAHGKNYKDTKRKRTSRIKRSSNIKPIHDNENANSKRKIYGVIDTFSITEETCQTEDAIKKATVTRGENLVQDSGHSKRQGAQRQSTRFNVQESEPIDKLVEMDGAKESKETARPSLRRRSARIRPEESESLKSSHEIDEAHCLQPKNQIKETEEIEKLFAMDGAKETASETVAVSSRPSLKRRSARLRHEEAEPCKSFDERDEVRETIKRRVSSRQQPARFDLQEPEMTETLNADDAGSLVSEETVGSKSETVEPSESIHDTTETNAKCRVSTRRQSTKGKSQKSIETDAAFKEIATDSSITDETEGVVRRTSVGRPSRHAAEKVQSYREVSLKVKMRRD